MLPKIKINQKINIAIPKSLFRKYKLLIYKPRKNKKTKQELKRWNVCEWVYVYIYWVISRKKKEISSIDQRDIWNFHTEKKFLFDASPLCCVPFLFMNLPKLMKFPSSNFSIEQNSQKLNSIFRRRVSIVFCGEFCSWFASNVIHWTRKLTF